MTDTGKSRLRVKWVISEHTTTDGRRFIYLSPEDGGTGDVEVVEEKYWKWK